MKKISVLTLITVLSFVSAKTIGAEHFSSNLATSHKEILMNNLDNHGDSKEMKRKQKRLDKQAKDLKKEQKLLRKEMKLANEKEKLNKQQQKLAQKERKLQKNKN